MLRKFIESKTAKNIFIIFSYLLLTIVFTWPILPNIHTKLTDTGDPFFISWVVDSELDKIKSGDIKNFWNGNIFYPYQNTIAYSDHSLTLTLEALPVSFFTDNPIFIANYLQLLSFLLSAVFAYFLAFYYTKSRKAAFISGFIFAFSAYHIGQISHIQVSSYQFIPLVILFFEKFLKKQSLKNGFLLLLFFLLNAFVSIYHLGFIVFPLLIIFLVRWRYKEISFDKYFWLKSAALFISLSALLTPMLYPYYKVTQELNTTKGIEEHASFSANPIDLAIAPSSNFILGDISKRITDKSPSPFWVEHTLYFGIFTVLFSALGFFKLWKRGKGKSKLWNFDYTSTQVIYFCLAIVSGILALGPFLFNQQQRIKLPYYFLYKFIPLYQGLRVPTRASILAVLSLSILVCYFALKFESLKKIKKYSLYFMLFIILFIEHLSSPIALITPADINNELYSWTSQNISKESVILHYPFGQEINYERGSQIDGIRTFNGYSGVSPQSYIRFANTFSPEFEANPTENLQIASTMGIEYVILHNEYFEDINRGSNLKTNFLNISGIKEIQNINSSIVFDIRQLKNTELFETRTLIKAEVLETSEVSLTHINPTDKSWINQNNQNYNIKIKFIKNNEVVSEKILNKIHKPLYLKPNEFVSQRVKFRKPLLKNFDRVEVEVN